MSSKYDKLKRGARLPKNLILLPTIPGSTFSNLFLYIRNIFGGISFRSLLQNPSAIYNGITQLLKHFIQFPLYLYKLQNNSSKSRGFLNTSTKYGSFSTPFQDSLQLSFFSRASKTQSSKNLILYNDINGTEIFPPFIEIKERKVIDYIFNHGSFGKGCFSRSYPSSTLEGESLQLDVYEANFLANGVGALELMIEPQKSISSKDLWKLSLAWGEHVSNLNTSTKGSHTGLNPGNEFLINYIAYHYFRSQKWVVKCGLKYSSNFVLYRDGPMYRHSEFAVFVKGVSSKTIDSELESIPQSTFSWQEIFNISRLCSQVKKKPLICYVFYPEEIPTDDIESCLSSYEVKTFQFERWSPSKTRE